MGNPNLFRIPSIFAGLDTFHSEEVKAAGFKWRDIQNMRFDGTKGKKRGGQSAYGGAAAKYDTSPVRSAFRFYPAETYNKVQILTSGTNIYKGNDSTGAITSIKTVTTGLRYTFAVMYTAAGVHNVFMANGTDTMQAWDGNAASTSDVTGSPPKGKFVLFHRDRLWVAGVAANPQWIYWSANSNPNDWTTADDAGTMDVGFVIKGIAKVADYIVIFGERQIKMLIGYSYDTFTLTEPFSDFGTVCSYSICAGNGVLYFLAQTGPNNYQLAAFNGSSGRILSDDVQLTLAYAARMDQVQGIFHNDRVLISYPSGDGSNDRQLVYNTKFGVFESIDVGIKADCYCKWDGVGDNGELYAGDASEGWLWKQDTSTLLDNTTAIDAYCESAYFASEAGDEFDKQFQTAYIKCDLSTSQTLTVLVTAQTDNATVTNSETLTGANASVTAEHRKSNFAVTGKNVKVKFSNSTASKDIGLYLYSIYYDLIKLR